MKKTIEIEFPDGWIKGKCEDCPLWNNGGCFLSLNKNGWCKLQVVPSKEKSYQKGFDDGYKKGHKAGADAIFSRYEDVW